MPPAEATWVHDHVIRPRIKGLAPLQPLRLGQTRCLHLPPPVCQTCRHGYHTQCTGWSWADLHETWICNRDGSYMPYLIRYGDSNYLVWHPPRPCGCSCPSPPTPDEHAHDRGLLFDLESM